MGSGNGDHPAPGGRGGTEERAGDHRATVSRAVRTPSGVATRTT